MDCIFSELKEVEDRSLILYVWESIHKQDIRSLYESFYKQEEMVVGKEDSNLDENDTYITECEEFDDMFLYPHTIREQKEKEEKQQQKALYPDIENNPDIENYFQQKT
jgi:hypothetical protein